MHASASTRVRLCPWVSRSHLGKFLDRASRGVSARRASVPASFSAPFRTSTLPRRTLSPLLARARRPTPAPLRASADAPPDSEDASLSRTPLDPGAVRSPRPGDRVSGDGSRDWGVLVLLAAAAIFVCYADRSNISTAIIPMAHQFGWDKIREGGVLSAFFYGYALTQLLGGRLADRVGGKPVLLFGVLAWSLATFVTPEAAAAGVAPLLIARVTLGAGEGVAFPAVHALIARHVPKERQTTAVAAVTAASYAGAAFAFGVTPSIVVNGGWEAAFYTFGAAAVVWVPLWVPARFAVVNDEFVDGSGASRPERERVANPDSATRGRLVRGVVGSDTDARGSGDMRRAVRAIVGRVRSAELAPDVFRRGAGGSRGGSGGVHRPPVFHSGRARRRLGALGGRADPGGEVLGETRPTGVSDGGDGGTRGVHARGGGTRRRGGGGAAEADVSRRRRRWTWDSRSARSRSRE